MVFCVRWGAWALILLGTVGCLDGPRYGGGGGWAPADASVAPVRCVPQCAGRACGDDGCQGTCGACGDGRQCDQGRCVVDGVPCPVTELGVALGARVAQGTTAAGTSRHTAPCVASTASSFEASFGWTAPMGGRYSFSTEGSGFDTVLTVRDGRCDGAALACEDDSAGLSQQSQVSIDLLAGQHVVVVIDGYGPGVVGLYTLSITPDTSTDPCGGVPAGGRCANANTLEVCSAQTGSSTPQRTVIPCASGEICRSDGGEARCVLTAVCRDGDTRCVGAGMQRCAGGQWTAASCGGSCQQTALGAQCVAATPGTRIYNGVLRYNYRSANAARTAWQTTATRTVAKGFLVLSTQGGEVIDTAVTSFGDEVTGGRFSVDVPTSPGANDALIFVAAQADARGEIQLAVAARGINVLNSPAAPSGCRALTSAVRLCETRSDNASVRPAVWSWSNRGDALPADGAIEIPVESSDAARLFDWGRNVFNRSAVNLFGRDGDSLVIWFTPDVKWTCGNCANRVPYTFPTSNGEPLHFDSQLWFSGGPEKVAWASAVVTHELGHWVMSSYGRNPGEGGQHIAGDPVFPGMAWSEGWATFHNADLRDNPLYVSVDSSDDAGLAFNMWGLNLESRAYEHSGASWSRPRASAGIYQRMDENELAALLWRLSRTSRGALPLYQAMSSVRARLPGRDSFWERRYTRRTWRVISGSGIDPSSVRDTGEPAPMLADFLDALRCNGFPAADVDNVLVPATYYPYPSANPLCRN